MNTQYPDKDYLRRYENIAGLDEAGTGSWAGPVVAAAVILPSKKIHLPGLTDSKLLTSSKREKLFELIVKKCTFGIGIVKNTYLDRFGLSHAVRAAFEIALSELDITPDLLLIDGRDIYSFAIPHISIIKGDRKVRAISAASILAKVTRDRIMTEYAKEHPNYMFDKHKGYGTGQHRQLLKRYGPSPIHRLSYEPIKKLKCIQNAFL